MFQDARNTKYPWIRFLGFEFKFECERCRKTAGLSDKALSMDPGEQPKIESLAFSDAHKGCQEKHNVIR